MIDRFLPLIVAIGVLAQLASLSLELHQRFPLDQFWCTVKECQTHFNEGDANANDCARR